MTIQTLKNQINASNPTSAWNKGVKAYALELLENVERIDYINLDKELLNGAPSINAYSWGGCSLIYDEDIAIRLCTPSELRKTRNGALKPNAKEDWLDVQARAISQAISLIKRMI